MTQHRTIVAPSLLGANLGEIAGAVTDAASSGADWFHIDVMDGCFVPPITFGDNMVRLVRAASDLTIDTHLMIVEPDRHLETYAEAGTSLLTVHQEVTPHLHRTIQEIHRLGMQSGVAVNPGTPVTTVFDVLEIVDLVLIMTVNPGWGGQQFIRSSLPKIEALKTEILRQGVDTLIQVDGGINNETAAECKHAGADVLVAGSYIFGSSNRQEAIDSLRT